jgi:Microsomal signal peptidase 25 kDa subunit (SPC25)
MDGKGGASKGVFDKYTDEVSKESKGEEPAGVEKSGVESTVAKGVETDAPAEEEEEEEEGDETPPVPHKIETGDSIKVKQVLDDSTMDAVVCLCGHAADYRLENLKLFFMFLSCVFAMVAQFYPIPFPASRPLLGVCCASYGILSTVLQYMITFVDKDTILLTNSSKDHPLALRIRTSFPRFQDEFVLTVQRREYVTPAASPRPKSTSSSQQPAAASAASDRAAPKGKKGADKDKDSAASSSKASSDTPTLALQGNISSVRMYVGRYFTTEGEFDEGRFQHDVSEHIAKLEKGGALVEYSLKVKDKEKVL